LPTLGTRAAFADAIRWGLQAAAAHGARRIVCTDPDFADWPLDDPTLLQGLTAWLRLPQRRFVLLARRYGELPRRQPRFVAWRRHWAHAIEAWQPPDDLAADLPTLLVADAARWRGRCDLDERTAMLWREQIDAILQRSEPGFPVYTLGL
jgi:hypothetical protein